jgi:plasmid stabilization system protein ParE
LPVKLHPVRFTQTARAELIDAQAWYEREAPGLGRRFRAAIDALTERMSANPLQFPVVYKNVRRALLRRFPYSLFFVIEDDASLLVIACFHASRDPAHWQKRA